MSTKQYRFINEYGKIYDMEDKDTFLENDDFFVFTCPGETTLTKNQEWRYRFSRKHYKVNVHDCETIKTYILEFHEIPSITFRVNVANKSGEKKCVLVKQNAVGGITDCGYSYIKAIITAIDELGYETDFTITSIEIVP